MAPRLRAEPLLICAVVAVPSVGVMVSCPRRMTQDQTSKPDPVAAVKLFGHVSLPESSFHPQIVLAPLFVLMLPSEVKPTGNDGKFVPRLPLDSHMTTMRSFVVST